MHFLNVFLYEYDACGNLLTSVVCPKEREDDLALGSSCLKGETGVSLWRLLTQVCDPFD